MKIDLYLGYDYKNTEYAISTCEMKRFEEGTGDERMNILTSKYT